MPKIKHILPKWPRLPVLAAAVVCTALVLAVHAIHTPLNNLSHSWLKRLTPAGDARHQYTFVAINEADIEALGGWPLSRDYYGYLLHGLSEMGASCIGLDLLFDSPSRTHPEADEHLAGFMETASPVVLARVAADGTAGTPAVEPLELFSQYSAGGFSNLLESHAPTRMQIYRLNNDSLELSLGAEMARQALGAGTRVSVDNGRLILENEKQRLVIACDDQGALLIDTPLLQKRYRQKSLVSTLQAIADSSDMPLLENHVVMVAAVSAGLPVLVEDGKGQSLPAALYHLETARTILEGAGLRHCPAPLATVMVMLTALAVWLAAAYLSGRRRWMALGGAAAVLILAAVFRLVFTQTIFPLAPALVAGLLTLIASETLDYRQRQRHRKLKNRLYRKRLDETRSALTEAEDRLVQAEAHQADQDETYQEELLEARQQVQVLEKRLRDLKRYDKPAAVIERSYGGLIHGPASPLKTVLKLIDTVAGGDLPVIVQGETGTGKELVARAVHRNSARHREPFVAVNCGALSENLLESELFGHEKGAFTGAYARRKGRFELADGGTLFLDEITETAPAFQARLLRVIQEGLFERVGGEKTLKCNVRIIAATNRIIKEEVDAGRFRADLYYRLNGMTLELPPLRDRHGDIEVLTDHFLKTHGSARIKGFSDAAMEMMMQYDWPGNIRELENTVRRSAMLAEGQGRDLIQKQDLPSEMYIDGQTQAVSYQPLDEQILQSLQQMSFSRSAISKTAKALGDRDRGTITEYFRGLFFKELVACDYNMEKTIQLLAGTSDDEVCERVSVKVSGYLDNIRIALEDAADSGEPKDRLPASFKGLPKAYHSALESVIAWLEKNG